MDDIADMADMANIHDIDTETIAGTNTDNNTEILNHANDTA